VSNSVLLVDPLDRDAERVLTAASLSVAVATSAELAKLAHPAAHCPLVLVLDQRGGRTMPAALQAVKQAHPALGVVVLASQQDPAVMLEAMRAGANEFVTEPVGETLVAAVQRLLALRRPVVTGQVFAFVGAKGGVGTTTTAVNVATALAKAVPGRTLLVDLHLAHGDAALLLGAEPRFSIVDALENIHRFDEAFFRGLVTATKAGVGLLASADRALLSHDTGMEQVRSVVEFAAHLYPYVILDVPRSDAAALDALDTASSIVVVANQELSTVRSAGRLAATLRQRYGKERVRVIITRYDKQAEITKEDVEKAVATRVSHLVPSDYRVALQALNLGRPLALENHNRLAGPFRDIASDLAGLEPEAEPTKAKTPGSIFGRWTARG
jgi:pilus assembly protein CpaE